MSTSYFYAPIANILYTHEFKTDMSNVDISEALFSGATLASVEMALYRGSTFGGSAVNGAIMATSELASQGLTGKYSRGPVSQFMYGQHRNLTTAVIYSLAQEVKRMFANREIFGSEWRAILGNIFLALGSAELGRQFNAALGMAPGAISVADVAKIASDNAGPSISNDYGNGASNRGPPVVRSVYNI